MPRGSLDTEPLTVCADFIATPGERPAMTLYRISFQSMSDGQLGYQFTASRKEAVHIAARWKREALHAPGYRYTTPETSIKQINGHASQFGILALLNQYASHAENG